MHSYFQIYMLLQIALARTFKQTSYDTHTHSHTCTHTHIFTSADAHTHTHTYHALKQEHTCTLKPVLDEYIHTHVIHTRIYSFIICTHTHLLINIHSYTCTQSYLTCVNTNIALQLINIHTYKY